MTRDTTIVQILDGYRYGGAERVALSYRKVFSGLKENNLILAIDVGERLGGSEVSLKYSYLHIFISLCLLGVRQKVILFSHTTRALYLGCLVRLLFPFRAKIVHIRHFPLNGLPKLLIRLASPLVCKFILIAPPLRAGQTLKLPKKFVYINNFIVDQDSQSIPNPLSEKILTFANGRKILGFIGAMKPGKNPAEVLHVFAHLDASKYCCVMIGDGKEYNAVISLCHQLGCHNDVLFCGYQDDVSSLLDTIDFFFFPSWNKYEVMPMALLEAMAKNCTCIGYELEVVRYLLPTDNVFGFQQHQAIAEAITKGTLKKEYPVFDAVYGSIEMSRLLMEIT